jgi:SAM-dependent methyltransferase
MFWFNRQDERALYVDKREASFKLDKRSDTVFHVKPDMVADFTKLPFPSDTFALVVFDPPHLVRNGKNSRMSAKYGDLKGEWQDMLRKGFAECFRVLRPEGVLVFKWNELDVPVSRILALTPEQPLFGNRCGKRSLTHWIVFMKANAPGHFRPEAQRRDVK